MGQGWGIKGCLQKTYLNSKYVVTLEWGKDGVLQGCLQKKTYLNSKYVVTLEWGKDGVLKAAYRRRHTSTVNIW